MAAFPICHQRFIPLRKALYKIMFRSRVANQIQNAYNAFNIDDTCLKNRQIYRRTYDKLIILQPIRLQQTLSLIDCFFFCSSFVLPSSQCSCTQLSYNAVSLQTQYRRNMSISTPTPVHVQAGYGPTQCQQNSPTVCHLFITQWRIVTTACKLISTTDQNQRTSVIDTKYY